MNPLKPLNLAAVFLISLVISSLAAVLPGPNFIVVNIDDLGDADTFYYYRGIKLEALREGDWKLVRPVKPATLPSLFNLKTDLAETTDGLAPGTRPLGKAARPQLLTGHDQTN